MSFIQSLKKLEESNEFKSFKEKNKNAFLFSAFFVLSESKTEEQQFNFFIPEKQEAITFMLDETIKHKTEKFAKKDITKLNADIKIDLDQLQDIIKKEVEKQKLKPDKIIAILQKIKADDKNNGENKEHQVWNITCLSGFKILCLHIDCFNGRVLKSQQSSMFDMMQIKKAKK